MEKINYREQELELANRLLKFLESGGSSRQTSRCSGRVTQSATDDQLQLLESMGIRPKWLATEQEADEMILHYKAILRSATARW
jgi:hypothetical protein